MSNKIKTLKQATKLSKQHKSKHETIGFITGCFDILHEGHIDLFRFAKQQVDIIIVALDSDEAIRLGKGEGRPIHSQAQRAKVLSELESVDVVIPIQEKYTFAKDSVEPLHDKIRDLIQADFVITTPQADQFWQSKKARAEKKGVKILLFNQVKPTSSSKIISKISENY